MNITPVIITKNAAKTIDLTLESLKCFGEVIVYDTGSVDETPDIACKFKNVRLFRATFTGFGDSKNQAALLAGNDWILSIDSDEVLGPALLRSIRKLQPDENSVYRFRRYNYYKTRRIKYSGWGQEYVTRLYNRNNLCFNNKFVHESIETGKTKIITLKGDLRHYSYHSISEFAIKRDYYSDLFVKEQTGKRKTSPILAFLRGAFDFLNTFFIKLAFLDGYRGLLIAVSNANVTFFKYLKLYEANINNNNRVSLIINVKNASHFLKLTFESILFQNSPPCEIVFCYQSNNHEIEKQIEEFEQNSFISIVRIGIENFNINSLQWINEAVKTAKYEYLVFIESGSFVSKGFILDHLKKAQRGVFIKTRRIDLNLKETKRTLLSYEDIKKLSIFFIIRKLLVSSRLIKIFTQSGIREINLNSNDIGTVFSFFKNDFSKIAETKFQSGFVDEQKINLADILNSEGLRKKELSIFQPSYKLYMNGNGESPANGSRVLVCLDRLKYLNCGIGQVSLNLGRKLIENKNSQFNLNYLLPAKGFSEFDNRVNSIRLTAWRRLFPDFIKNFDLVHITHQLPVYNFGSAKKKLLTIHDLNFIYIKSKRKIEKYLRRIQGNIDKADAIVFISEFTKQICYQNLIIPENKIVRIIYNGVTAPVKNNNLPKWMESKDFIFSIGQFLNKKNFHVLIPFVKLLPENYMLIIAGENNTIYGQKIKKLIIDSNLENRIFLPGGISEYDKNYLFHNCKAFVFPSIAEGFGLPVIEAMLCNKPVFCSNRTSLKEIGNKFAFFWDNFDAEDMLEIFNKGMAGFNLEYMQEQFEYAMTYTYERNVSEYLKLYKELIAMSRA